MASTHVYYKVTFPSLPEFPDLPDLQLCFKCAVILAVNTSGAIYLATSEYKYTTCSHCGEFILDEISI